MVEIILGVTEFYNGSYIYTGLDSITNTCIFNAPLI